MDLNSVSLTGRLGQDSETTFFESGKCLTKFSLAVKGLNKDDVSWVSCQYWQNNPSGVVDYLKQGVQVAVKGRLKQERWEDRDTKQKREKMVVIIEGITLLGGNRNDTPAGEKAISKEEFEARKNGTAPTPVASQTTVEAVPNYEDIPF